MPGIYLDEEGVPVTPVNFHVADGLAEKRREPCLKGFRYRGLMV